MENQKQPAAATLVTAECVAFGFDGKRLRLLLVERGQAPALGMWALPGGEIEPGESPEQRAARALRDAKGIEGAHLEQFQTFAAPPADPRGRVFAIAFLALAPGQHAAERSSAGKEAAPTCAWFDADELPPLAFDHAAIVDTARRRLRELLKVKPVAFKMLDKEFKMSQLQTLYEVINGTSYDRRNFQRKILASGLVRETGGQERIRPCGDRPQAMPRALPSDEIRECRALPCAAPAKAAKPASPARRGPSLRFTFDEELFHLAEARDEWRKNPFDI